MTFAEPDRRQASESPETLAAQPDPELELILGAEAIGASLGITARQVYRLQEKGELPTFQMGGRLCTTRPLLKAHIAEKVRRVLAARPPR